THHCDSRRVAMGFAALNPSYDYGASLILLPHRLRPRGRRRFAEAAAEAAVEMGEIGKPRIRRDVADLARGEARIAQQAVRPFETPFDQMLRKRPARLLQQPVQITHRKSEAFGHLLRI